MSASSVPRTARAAKGHRVIRSVRLAAEVPTPGRLGKLWQRICALWQPTPEQCHTCQVARQTGSDGGDLRGRAVLSGERALLLASPELSGSSRRHPQGDLP